MAGAHDIDTHFVDTNPRHNLPVLLALTDVWNEAFLGSAGRIVTPFSDQFGTYASFVAALESETCARNVDRHGHKCSDQHACSGMVIRGSVRGEYDRVSYQGGRIFPSDLIACMHDPMDDPSNSNNKSKTPGGELSTHDRLMCTLFAHADLMAFGHRKGASSPGAAGAGGGGGSFYGTRPYHSTTSSTNNGAGGHHYEAAAAASISGSGGGEQQPNSSEGNRPSSLLLCSKCDAFTCGQLVALAEHRAMIAATLWDLDPFTRDVGSSLREGDTERLKHRLQEIWSGQLQVEDNDEDEGDGGGAINFATKTVLTHYASQARQQR
jgi:glucose-6-phosphate isomerase